MIHVNWLLIILVLILHEWIVVRAVLWIGVCCLSSGEVYYDGVSGSGGCVIAGVTIYNKNYKKVVLRVH
jgi:hypothetical protein